MQIRFASGHAGQLLIGVITAATLTLSACSLGTAPAATTTDVTQPKPAAATRPTVMLGMSQHALPAGQVPVARPVKNEVAQLVAPPNVPPAITRKEPALVKVEIETVEKEAELADGVRYKYWTFGGTVPGPMIRVREGDTVALKLKNSRESMFPHSIDLHAVTGPGGGAKATQTMPGGDTEVQFAALNPGLYVYHCATPNIPQHIANGMYGMILVEPKDGMAPVEREYYVMQGDFYTQGAVGDPGMQGFSSEKLLAERPEYVVFNGKVGSLTGDSAMKAKVGDRIRVFFGVGGPNLTSSFHIIGEVFDKVYQEGNTANPAANVQTTLVPAGGAAWVEFKADVPGALTLVDHSLSRLARGAAGAIIVEGAEYPEAFKVLKSGNMGASGH